MTSHSVARWLGQQGRVETSLVSFPPDATNPAAPVAPFGGRISPADQGPILSILSASALDRFSFTVGGETGRSYRIESSTNVMNWSQETSFQFGSSSSAVREGFTSVVSAQGSTAFVELRKSSERKYFRSSRYVPSNEVCNATLKMIRFGKDVWAMEKGKS